jgi:hypothetical protein
MEILNKFAVEYGVILFILFEYTTKENEHFLKDDE